MSKHTKGPWHTQYGQFCTAICAGEKVVGYIDHFNEHDKRLLMAAPDLLEALKQMVSIVAIHSRATKNNFAWAEMDEARAAIAKAGGE